MRAGKTGGWFVVAVEMNSPSSLLTVKYDGRQRATTGHGAVRGGASSPSYVVVNKAYFVPLNVWILVLEWWDPLVFCEGSGQNKIMDRDPAVAREVIAHVCPGPLCCVCPFTFKK